MRIYCPLCKRSILEASPDFVSGGPYHGGMFQEIDKWRKRTFDCRPHIKAGLLSCPACNGGFIGRSGEILTEHGVIKAGQKTFDPGFSIIHGEGPSKGSLMHIKDSLPAPEVKEEVPEIKVSHETIVELQELFEKCEPLQYENILEPETRNEKIVRMHREGVSMPQIAREVGLSRQMVKIIIKKAE